MFCNKEGITSQQVERSDYHKDLLLVINSTQMKKQDLIATVLNCTDTKLRLCCVRVKREHHTPKAFTVSFLVQLKHYMKTVLYKSQNKQQQHPNKQLVTSSILSLFLMGFMGGSVSIILHSRGFRFIFSGPKVQSQTWHMSSQFLTMPFSMG